MALQKIVLIANYLPDKQDSMLRLADLFCRVISDSGLEVEVLRPKDVIGRLRCVIPSMGKWLGYMDKYLLFPFFLITYLWQKRNRTDAVYHITDHSNAVYSLLLLKKPRIATCNDVLAIRSARGEIPENPTRLTGRILQKAILMGLANTPRVVCISQNSERDLRSVLGKRSPETSFVFLPLNFNFQPLSRDVALATLQSLGKQDVVHFGQEVILHVGGNQWYKNRIGVLKIFAELCRIRLANHLPILPLVMAGKEPDENLKAFVKEHGSLPIHFLIEPSTPQLCALYSLAKVFVFPSLQEGFGWPILEAMACGCPVVTTGHPPMTEVGGSAAVYIKPQKVSESARSLNEVLEWSASARADFVERGFQNLKRFTQEQFASHYLAAYKNVHQSPSKP